MDLYSLEQMNLVYIAAYPSIHSSKVVLALFNHYVHDILTFHTLAFAINVIVIFYMLICTTMQMFSVFFHFVVNKLKWNIIKF